VTPNATGLHLPCADIANCVSEDLDLRVCLVRRIPISRGCVGLKNETVALARPELHARTSEFPADECRGLDGLDGRGLRLASRYELFFLAFRPLFDFARQVLEADDTRLQVFLNK